MHMRWRSEYLETIAARGGSRWRAAAEAAAARARGSCRELVERGERREERREEREEREIRRKGIKEEEK